MTIDLVAQIPTFCSPVTIFKIPYEESFKSKVIEECMKTKKDDKEGIIPEDLQFDHVSWQSKKNLFTRQDPNLKIVADQILSGVMQTAKTIDKNFDISKYDIKGDGWININETGTLHMPHVHNSSTFSGVIYIKIPINDDNSIKSKSGFIEFLDPRNTVLSFAGEIAEFRNSNVFKEKITIMPKEGHLLVFPSFLKHWVYPVKTNEDRISISFNISFLYKK